MSKKKLVVVPAKVVKGWEGEGDARGFYYYTVRGHMLPTEAMPVMQHVHIECASRESLAIGTKVNVTVEFEE